MVCLSEDLMVGVVYEKLMVGLVEDLMHGWFGVETTYYFCFKFIIIFV
jgi:hypothetical protein